MNSPPSLCKLDKAAAKETGGAKTPLDEPTAAKAESRYPAYYEYFTVDVDSNAQGTAPFE